MGHGFCLEGREDLKPGSPAGPQVGTGAQGPRSWGFFCCQLGRGDTRHSPLLTSCCSSPHSALSPAALPGGDQVPPVFEFPGDVTEPATVKVRQLNSVLEVCHTRTGPVTVCLSLADHLSKLPAHPHSGESRQSGGWPAAPFQGCYSPR